APSTYVNGGWVCAGKDFFIRDNNTKKTYSLIKANDIPICPKKYNFQYKGQVLEFNLVFKSIPSSTTNIDIIEDESSGGFNFYGVELESSNNYSSETKTLKSDGKFRKTDSPLSDVIKIIPAGTRVKIISLVGGYYKAEHGGQIGYLSELYFQSSGITSKPTTTKPYKPSNTKPTNCNEIKVISKSSKPSFSNMLAGVKYAVIINQPKINGHWNAFNALSSYLRGMDFTSVEYLNENYKQPSNLCEEVWVAIYFEYKVGVAFYNIRMEFTSPCTGYTWDFSTSKRANDGVYSDAKYQFGKALRDMYGYKKPSFNSYYTLKLPKKQTCWTENKIRQEFQKNGADKLEGIYENSSNTQAKYRVALKKIKDTYHLIYLTGANNHKNWSEGEIKATLVPTATSLFFNFMWVMANKSLNDDFYISFEQGIMNVIDSDKEKSMYIKMYPTSSDNISSASNSPSSGTGFAITSNGLIVTNNHVIDGAKTIKVRGVNGDFNRTYTAKLIITDKNNDLAIIKIDDYSFSSLGNVPYTIKTSSSGVGEDIFVLGYPLRASMGDEVKLTDGIISSKTGFQGDVTSYQISAPVQPGNSGGPLFNRKGQMIGIINAKHIGAENASYAVKSSYLTN
ncbi:MAG: trypsin-like peptidase domain-containing protein, partial [Ignavibacteriae bacterium]|nr:trypsin-like peptidase domain-containing protein [Ignavibacteriota bacterium]